MPRSLERLLPERRAGNIGARMGLQARSWSWYANKAWILLCKDSGRAHNRVPCIEFYIHPSDGPDMPNFDCSSATMREHCQHLLSGFCTV